MARPPTARKRFSKPLPPRLWGKDELLIERMSREGRGIGTRQGKIVFVNGALPDERVRVQCTAVKRDYDEADMLGLATGSAASTARMQPGCPVYGDCGGCSLQHWAPAAQLQHKQASLLAMLRRVAPDIVLDAPIESPASGYRHRLRLAVLRNPDGSPGLGLRQRRSRTPVAVDDCLVADSAVNLMLRTLPARLAGLPRLRGLRDIEIDSDTEGGMGLCLYFATRPDEAALAALRETFSSAVVAALRVRVAAATPSPGYELPAETDAQDTAAWQDVHAAGELCLSLAGPGPAEGARQSMLRLAYLPGDFTQTHWAVNAALVARAITWLQPAASERALDLFSGIGNFSLPLAQRVAAVEALEGDAAMTGRLQSNAVRNRLPNISARTVNLMAQVPRLPGADIAIVDPPRAGAKALCEVLPDLGIKRLVYVSCHPATLLRDAATLQQGGLNLVRAAAVDMFPHTGHSEAIALFERRLRR